MKILKITFPKNTRLNIAKIINEEVNSYKSSYVKKIINEEINTLFESRKTEELAMNALIKRNVQNPDALLNKFKEIDKTKNQTLLPAIAKAYIEHPNLNDLNGVFEYIGEEINKNKIKNFVASKKGYTLDDNQFKDWLDLAGHIHQLQTAAQTDVDDAPIGDVEIEGETPEWENEKIAIYDGTDKNKCIRYGAGSITGKKYTFCIGQSSGGMHQSYRDTKSSTFWYVFDKTKSIDDPLHMVVVDAVDPAYAEQRGMESPYELTDVDNHHPPTKISEFGSDVQGYLNYLKTQGVPIEKLGHIPHSEEEKIALQLLKQPNSSVEWFKNLGTEAQKLGFGTGEDINKLTYKLQSQYIGRGHSLSNEQFMYLWPFRKQQGAFTLLKQYVSTGQALPESQFNVLTGQTNGQ